MEAKILYDYSDRKKLTDLPFPLSEYEARIQNARRLMQQHDLDALVAFSDQPGRMTINYGALHWPSTHHNNGVDRTLSQLLDPSDISPKEPVVTRN